MRCHALRSSTRWRSFTGSPLVRVPRLSVIPVTGAQWRRLLALGG